MRAERGSDVVVVLVGNKTDLVERRQVTTEEGDARGREAGVLFIETSAKAGFNIKARTHADAFSACTPVSAWLTVATARRRCSARLQRRCRGWRRWAPAGRGEKT